jgi:hypothetical protein
MVVFMTLAGLLFVTLSLSTTEVRQARHTIDDVRTRYLAEAGFERGMQVLNNAVRLNNQFNPLDGLNNLFAGGDTISPVMNEALMEGGAQVGAFSVTMNRIGQTDTSVVIQIDSTGYLPTAPADLAPGQRLDDWEAIRVTVQYDLAPSSVFDYAYFINNWGWFYGSTIFANGNVRSNGQFDVAGYAPTVNGQPIYLGTDVSGGSVTLSGYQDDNGDGLMDGEDGGVWSGWDIVAAQNLKGTGGNAENQHDFQDAVEMPNLSDLSWYEDYATGEGGSITIGGSTVVSGVCGDDAGESDNLYLVGTATDPIVLDGPIVAQGDVIISGYVTGQGAIYAGGNVYVPNSITYLDPPTSPRPTGTTQAETEAWLTSNQDKDFLGLFAAENIVVGDYTHSYFNYYVGGWMSSSMNESSEDSGEDLIPNTADGRDGIPGTADDDVLEGDGVFSIEVYTAMDGALGLIPPGKSVGDPIPGTGEDIDGDGEYDDTTTLADVAISAALDPLYWEGNMPPGGIAQYKDIASLYANRLDAVFYTNHTFAYLVLGSTAAKVNGAIVSRNEAIVYGTPSISINHDSRLLGGNSGLVNNLLPKTMQSPSILRWQSLDTDPNHSVGVAP